MNIPQARQTLRKAIPPGEDLLSMNNTEFNWLQANKPKWFGSGKKQKKSGIRSFWWGSDDSSSDSEPGGDGGGSIDDTDSSTTNDSDWGERGQSEREWSFDPSDIGKLDVGGYLKDNFGANDPSLHMGGPGHEGETAAEYNARMTGHSNTGGGSGGSGVPGVPGMSGGFDTRTPTGPSSTTNPNDPYGIQKKIAKGASDLIDKEYEAPTLTPEERIAGPSEQTLRARTGVDDLQGKGQEAYTKATGVGEDISGYQPDKVGSQSFLGGKGLDQYQNPHTAEVIKRNTDSAMDAMDIRRNQLVAKESMASPSGQNDRAAIERGVMQAQGLKNLGDQTAALYSQGFDKAADMKRYDMDSQTGADRFNVDAGFRGADTRLKGADAMIAGTDAGRRADITDIDLLSKVGADVEGRDQNVLDETMGDFYEKRDWGENKLASAANIAGTMPTGSTTTSTGAPQHKRRDKFGRIISGAATGWLASGGNPWGAAAGAAGGLFS